MPDLGKAYVQIVPSAQGIQGSITSVLGGEVNTAGETARKVLGSKLALGAVAGGVAVAKVGKEIAKFAAESVKVGMGFDSSMSQVAATMGTTVDQIGDLRDFAKEMGASTAFSATQAADALNYMALAGYDAQTSMDMLPNVLNLAAAGGIQLARASDMITDAQSALGLSLEDTNVLVDQMARASSKSNTSVEQLGDAILTIGATARNIKGGTAELATVLGVLADNGIKGAEGGTHLRNILLSLQTPTNAGAEALAKLGMTYDDMYDAAGNMRSIPDIMLQLQAGMEGMTQASKDAIISGIFNKTDLASVNALIGTSAERFDELSASIENSTGAAQKMADTQLDNLAGDVTLYKSAVEGLQIAVADKLNPALRFFVELGTDVVGGLTEIVEGFDNGVPSVDELTRSTQAFYDTVESGRSSLESSTTDIEATALVAERYITALESMGDTANMTAAEHEQYHNYLVLLTQTIPELASIINLETDEIEGGTDALHDNTAAWEARKKAQAGDEYLAEVYQAQADVLLEQARNSVELTRVTKDLSAAETRREELLEAISAIQYDWATGKYDLPDGGSGYDQYTEELAALNDELLGVDVNISTLQKTQKKLDKAAGDNADAVAAAEAEITLAEDTVAEFNRMLDGTGDASEAAADGISATGEAAAGAGAVLDEASQSLADISAAAEQALQSGGDLRKAYDDLSGQLDALEGDLDAETLAMTQQQLATLNLAATNQELADSYPLLVDRLDGSVHGTLSNLSSWLIDNGISAEEWGRQVHDATGNVINGFSELDTSLGMNLDEMAANMRGNIDAYTNWESNIKTLMDAAVASGDSAQIAFVQHMQDMGIGAADQVALMAQDAEGTLAEFGPMMAEAIDVGMTDVYQSVENSDIGTAAEGAVQEVVDALEGGDYSGAGVAIAGDVAESLSAATGDIASAVSVAMDSATMAVSTTDLSGPMREVMAGAARSIKGTDLSAPMKAVMDSAVRVIDAADFKGAGAKIPKAIATGLYENQSAVSTSAKGAVSAAEATAAGAAASFYWVGYYMDQGIISGLRSGSNAVSEAAKAVAKSALKAAKEELEIGSPSKVFRDEVGVWIPAGIAEGVQRGAYRVTDSVAELADAAVGSYDAADVDLGSYYISGVLAAGGGRYSGGKTVNITNQFTVSGAENPEDYADRLARRLSMQMRMA